MSKAKQIAQQMTNGIYPIQPDEIGLPTDDYIPSLNDSEYASSPKTNRFKVRMLGGLSGAAGLSVDVLFFQFWDELHQLTAFYTYWGSGLGAGVEWAPMMSGTTAGDWNDFTTTVPVPVGIFIGPARFSTGGIGMWSINFLHIPCVGGTSWGVYIQMNTGTTIGLGVSTTMGFLQMNPSEVLPYKGE